MIEALLIAAVLLAAAAFALTRKKTKAKAAKPTTAPAPQPAPPPPAAPRNPAPPAEPSPEVVSYRSFQGQRYTRQKVPGENVSLLVPAVTPECAFIQDYCEQAYAHYAQACGFDYANGVTIAVVPDGATCGAGCGNVGAAGIEIMQSFWDTMLAEAKQGRAHQIPLYELGRNFWTLGGKCEFGGLMTGFAIYHRMVIAGGLDMADQDGQPWPEFEERVRGLIDTYLADDSLNYSNTFAIDKGIPGNLGGADLVASLLLRLDDLCNTRGVWAKAHKLPPTQHPAQQFVQLYPKAAQAWLLNVIGFPG